MAKDWTKDKKWLCHDCQAHTGVMGDYYMIKDELWERHGCREGMLCIACLEARMGRELNPEDFTEALVNKGVATKRSELMRLRVGR
jgi:hypothetical protein